MLVRVTKDTVKIIDDNYILNKGEYHVNKCYFQFSEEYTDDLVKKAIFAHGDTKKEMLIAGNQCNIPYEVLVNDSFELRVYAYEIDPSTEDLILRYSPTHTMAYLREGSYISGATAGEEITPTQFEQYQQALQEGLAEVNDKLDDVDTAITEANNLDAEVTKSLNISTLSLTKKDGSIQSVNIFDGQDGATGRDGTDGKDAKINGVNTLTVEAGENITLNQAGSTLTISATGSGGTSDYSDLTNKPKINNVELSGNKTTSDLGLFSGNYNDLTNKPTIPTVPTNVSAFTNDAGYINDISGKQDTLVSGTNIKTINNTSILGSGNLDVGNDVSIDDETITTNADDEIQTVGIKDNNNNTCKIWNGTLQQYNAIQNKDSNTIYNITDDYTNNGVPSGGTTGQVLSKTSSTDFDTEWKTFSHETWTFTLEDDTIVDKEVVLW